MLQTLLHEPCRAEEAFPGFLRSPAAAPGNSVHGELRPTTTPSAPPAAYAVTGNLPLLPLPAPSPPAPSSPKQRSWPKKKCSRSQPTTEGLQSLQSNSSTAAQLAPESHPSTSPHHKLTRCALPLPTEQLLDDSLPPDVVLPPEQPPLPGLPGELSPSRAVFTCDSPSQQQLNSVSSSHLVSPTLQ